MRWNARVDDYSISLFGDQFGSIGSNAILHHHNAV